MLVGANVFAALAVSTGRGALITGEVIEFCAIELKQQVKRQTNVALRMAVAFIMCPPAD